jgi:[ribosomal protein S5]-alanine N-acetyltransferase
MSVYIRPWTMFDHDNLLYFANNYNIARYMTNRFPYPYTSENAVSFIELANSVEPNFLMAIDYNGIAVGGIGIHKQEDIMERNAEIGYWLAQDYWNIGIMTVALNQMIEYAFYNFDIDRIFARVFGTNIGSQKVLVKCGFVFEASFSKTIFKFGEYEDELIFSIRRSNY